MLKYFLPLIFVLPVAPAIANPYYQSSMCIRTKKTVIAGSYDNYGRWRNPYSIEEDRVEPCYKTGYVPPVGRPAMTEATTQRRYYGPNSQYRDGVPYYEPVATQPSMTREQCRNRSILGALAGGGIAAAVAKNNHYSYGWAIPIGAVAGVALARSGECADLR